MKPAGHSVSLLSATRKNGLFYFKAGQFVTEKPYASGPKKSENVAGAAAQN
jgi:hypothetical protein